MTATDRTERAPARSNGGMVRTPTVLQMEATECGAASLTMIIRYFGRYASLEEVRNATAVSRDGVNALKLVHAGRQYGLEAKGLRYDVDQLRSLATPFIVFWNQNHFVVVEGFHKGRVRLNDPAIGRRWVSDEEFESSYSRVALHFEPGPSFEQTDFPKELSLGLMIRLLGRSRSGLLYAVIAGLAVVVPTTALALASAVFINTVLDEDDTAFLPSILVVTAISLVLLFTLNWLQQRILLRLQTKLSLGMTSEFLWHMLRLPSSYFDARSPGGMVTRVSLNASVAELLSGQLATAGIATLTMALYAVAMLWLSVGLSLVAFAVAALNAVALIAVSRARVAANQQLQQTQIALSGYTFMGMSMIDDLKATGGEDEYFGRWSGTQAAAVNSEQRLGALTQALLAVPPTLTTLNVVAILGVGGWLVINGDLNVGELYGFSLLAAAFLLPVTQLVSAASSFQDARAWLTQLRDVSNQPIDPLTIDPAAMTDRAGSALESRLERADSGTGRVTVQSEPADVGEVHGEDSLYPLRELRGHLEVRDLTFGYVPNEPPLLEGFSLRLAPGERAALVGTTGSGKSTIANLVVGLLEPWDGEILFDGTPRSRIPRSVLSSSVAKVDQSISLFSGSVADNIRFFDDDVDLQDVVRAAEDASIDEEIQLKPGGYSHQLAEGGRNLSGGQRQRMEIARALAVNPSIMLLDEATSALDTISEARVDAALRRRGCTCLLVAHRLSTIRDCDQIVVLDHGQVVERGIHEELLELGGLYAALVADG